MHHPTHLKYAKTHEWALLEDGIVITGISDFAQDSLGDLVFVEVPAVGTQIQAGQPVGVVESVKTASDIHAPVSGEIIAINPLLADEPEIVNSDPYTAGWIYKIKPSHLNELDTLISSAVYESGIG